MVLPVVGDRCVPDKQVQAASVRVLFVGTSRLRGHPRRGWRLGLCVWRLSGRHGVPADWETPGLATSPSFPVGACVLSWHARGVPGHVRACAPPIVLARAISLACAHAARATNHSQHNAGPRIHDRCIPRIQVFRHVSDASRNQGTDGILNVRSLLAPSCRAPRQARPPRPLLMKPRATVR